tara:strand:+ start:703 stop:1152 length:450 start_codon:yes stop_codon:yes gene_type:complete
LSEIFFYKLKNTSSEIFLTSLIEKSIDNDWNSVVLFDNIERMEEINDFLWSYKDTSFLPHGSQNDKNPELHRVYLTCEEENPNNSHVILSIDGLLIKNINLWQRCIYIFNEQNLRIIDQFNIYKRNIDKSQHILKSFEQDANGKWINSN